MTKTGQDDHIEQTAIGIEPAIYKKVKAFNPQIVVSGEPDKPYYNISYYDVVKKEWYIAYGSYCLENVYRWLFECFEEVDSDMVAVIRCNDCKYFELNPFDGCEVCTHINGYVRPDFGCVDGERKNK